MKSTLDQLEGQSLPLVLGSVCMLMKTDLWRNWEEYEEAHFQRDAMVQYFTSRKEHSLFFIAGLLDHQDKETGTLQVKLDANEAEIARLQA